MDTELFQILSIALLFLVAVLLLVASITLAQIRKGLRDQAAARGEMAAGAAGGAASMGVDLAPERGRETEEARREEARAEEVRAAEREGEAPPEEERAAEPAAVSAASQEPQEQPFERDGRWWFRRGDELLVYDEGTGQWVAAAQGEGGGGQATAAAAQQETATAEQPAAEQEEGGFWRCPSCGAVNGSTATSCRMCFAARP
jgi:hypothetical protein